MHYTDYDTRLAGYAVVGDDAGRVLLSWFNGGASGADPAWTLPGGGVEFEESIEEAVVREVREETGFDVELTGLLCADSIPDPATDERRAHKSVRIVYTARITGGTLGTLERDGTTDRAAWLDPDTLATEPHVGLIDRTLSVWRQRGSSASA